MKHLPSVAMAAAALSLAIPAISQSGPQSFVGSNATQVVRVQQNGSGNGLTAFTASKQSVSAVFARATAATGNTVGLWGSSLSSAGTGVLGAACDQNSIATCTGIGVHGVVWGRNTTATAGVFEIKGSDGGGNILLGLFDGARVFRVGESGDVYADGGVHTSGADFAEKFSVNGTESAYQPGDVLVIDPDHDRRVALAQTPYSTFVAGIYSTKPGVVASPHDINDAGSGEVPMAVVGVVPTKVSAENGPIHRGDLLVTSSRAGYAMKGTDRTRMVGAVVGKALQPMENKEGTIQVLVTLQ